MENNAGGPPPFKENEAPFPAGDELKPWWQSKTILALIATLIISASSRFGILPPEITHEEVTSFLIIAAPVLVAIWGRLGASKPLTPAGTPLQPISEQPSTLFRIAPPPRSQMPEFLLIIFATAGVVVILLMLFK